MKYGTVSRIVMLQLVDRCTDMIKIANANSRKTLAPSATANPTRLLPQMANSGASCTAEETTILSYVGP